MFSTLLTLAAISSTAQAQDADGQMSLVFTCPDARCPAVTTLDGTSVVMNELYPPIEMDEYADGMVIEVGGTPWVIMPTKGNVAIQIVEGYEGQYRLQSPQTRVFPMPVERFEPDVELLTVDEVTLATCQFAIARNTDSSTTELNWTLDPECQVTVPNLQVYNRPEVVVLVYYGADRFGDTGAGMDTNDQARKSIGRAHYLVSYLQSQGLTEPQFSVEPIGTLSGGRQSKGMVKIVPMPVVEIPEIELPSMPDWVCGVADAKDLNQDGTISPDECKSPRFNPLNHLRLELHALAAVGYTGHNEQLGGGLILRFNGKHSLRLYGGAGLTPVPGWVVEDGDYDPSTWQGTPVVYNNGDYTTVGYSTHYGIDYWYTNPSGRLLNPMWSAGLGLTGLRIEAGDGRPDQLSGQVKVGPMWDLKDDRWLLALDGYAGLARGEIDQISGPSTESVGDLTRGVYGVADYGVGLELTYVIGGL